MTTMSPVKRLCIAAVCVAMCCVLPAVFHSVGLGSTFCPMHIPVLLCGLICGGYGVICGIIGPILSSILTSMPGTVMLITMVPELIVYGLVTALAMRYVRTGKVLCDLYISLGAAMIAGRVAGGIAKAIFYAGTGEAFSLSLWISGYFITSLPGIICHLILIPLLVITLMKAKVIPGRYSKST